MTGPHNDKTMPLEKFSFAWPFPKTRNFLYNVKSCFTMVFVSSVSRILFFRLFNRMIVHNKQRFITVLEDKSRPLITMSNHRSNIDDPLLWTMVSWREFFRNIWRWRYTLAAHNICFTTQFHTTIFSLGRCVPCVRGAGIDQEGMNFSKEMLDQHGWVHIFPEGRVTPIPMRFKWGIGRLIMESNTPPIVLPIWCENMSSVWPTEPPYYPRFGNTVEVYVGEPIDTAPLIARFAKLTSIQDRRKAITDVLQDALYEMAERLDYIPKGTAKRLHDESNRKKTEP